MQQQQQQLPQQHQQQAQPQVNMEEACALFRQGVTSVFRQWMVLHLAVSNNWGGGDSYRKATILLEETLRLFLPSALPRAAHRPKKIPSADDLEEKLGDYIEEQFGTLIEDGSLEEVSALVCRLWEDCKQGGKEGVREVCGKEAEVLRLQQRWGEVSREASRMEEDLMRREEGEEELREDEDEDEEGGWGSAVGGGRGGGMDVDHVQGGGGGAEGGRGMGEDEEEEGAPALEEEDGWTTVKSTKKTNKARRARLPQQPTLFG
ncbi:Hypothetical protein NocV09_05300120 [Nannochloropsis oceanica]